MSGTAIVTGTSQSSTTICTFTTNTISTNTRLPIHHASLTPTPIGTCRSSMTTRTCPICTTGTRTEGPNASPRTLAGTRRDAGQAGGRETRIGGTLSRPRRSLAMQAMPAAGPSARIGKAQRQPAASWISGTSWIVASVNRKPSEVWSVSAVPTACGGATSVTSVEN